MEIQKALNELKALKIDYNLDLGIDFKKAQSEIDQALQLQQTGVMARCNINLVGKELEYISPITKATTKFKVADVFVNIFNVGLKKRKVYGEVFAVSENGNKYKIDEFSEVRIPQ